MTYSRNKNAGQWKAHGHYLARERATEKSEKNAAGFSRSENSVDIAQRLGGWQKAGNERLFKLIDRSRLCGPIRSFHLCTNSMIPAAVDVLVTDAIANPGLP